jgi:uncharacterized protein
MSGTKPTAVFGREIEWDQLHQFHRSARVGHRLAIVYGRRRQGKTLLLRAMVAETNGFYWQARQQSSAQNLESFALTLGEAAGAPTGLRLANWEDALATLLRVMASRPGDAGRLAVIDEVGYLLATEPSIPSHLQALLAPLSESSSQPGARLVLCGSAFGEMRRLIDTHAPLRGRHDMELVLRPFDFREAAHYWGLHANPDAAFRLHALVGGTPAYREYAGGDLPSDGDIDGWAARNLLKSSSPLYREGRVVIGEDTALVDQGLYWGVLGAIAEGARSRSQITEALGRPPTSLAYALDTVVEAGWVVAEQDPLRQRGATYHLDEPIVRFQRLITEPNDARVSLRRDPTEVWKESLPIIRSQIHGPHLERLARLWTLGWASDDTLDGRVNAVGPSFVTLKKERYQLDLVATEKTPRGGRRVLAIGEIKANASPVGVDQLARLDSIAAGVRELAEGPLKRILVARSGFTSELQSVARRRGDVELVDMYRLYNGD